MSYITKENLDLVLCALQVSALSSKCPICMKKGRKHSEECYMEKAIALAYEMTIEAAINEKKEKAGV